MRPSSRLQLKPRPLHFSLARLSSAAAIAAALLAAGGSAQAVTFWEGNLPIGPIGDGFLFTNPNNWQGETVPSPAQDVSFGTAGATVGTILLNGNQTVNSLDFTESYTLGAYGTSNVLTNTLGQVTVTPGDFATINASYGGTNGINLSGGGTLFLNNPLTTFAGNISISGAGTTLLHRQEGPTVQYNGINSSQEVGRFDQVTLGYTTSLRTITVAGGGEYKIINAGNNAEANYKNIVVGAGGGAVNLAAGYLVQNLDDIGQISSLAGNTLILNGKGRLTIAGALADGNFNNPTGSNLTATNPIQGDVVVNGGVFELGRLQGQGNTNPAVPANTRFSGMTGTTSPNLVGTNVLTLNASGTLLLNNGTIGNLDVATVNVNGGILATANNGHEIGVRTQGGATPASTLNIAGVSTLMHRDFFGVQTGRNFFINSDLTGAGVLSILPSTQTGGASRLVIQRSIASTFSGTFRLNENANLELNPRLNAVAETGKLMANGDLDFAGWGSTLDLRDSDAVTGLVATVKDYTTNEITISTTQAGAVNIIAPGRAALAFGTGNLINFGTLTMGSTRLAIAGNNSYQTGFGDTSLVVGNAVIEMRADGSPLVFSNAAAIAEDQAGRSLTLFKGGVSNTVARDVISGGSISLSNLQVATGTLQLRGANGAITTGFGGVAPTITVNGSGQGNNANTLPTQGVLNLDGSTGHVVGTTTVFAAANNNNRFDDNAILNLRSNSTLRLTSAANIGTTETIGLSNVSGHGTFDVVKTGTTTSPVALTLSTLNLGANATANFTGTSLGVAGGNTSRIVIPTQVAGFMSAAFHQANEWAKYDPTPDNGFAIGVLPFTPTDYTIGSAEATWAAGQQIKQNGATLPTLTANRTADRFNFQTSAANQPLNLAGFKLTADQGGILNSVNTIGFKDGATGAVPSGTAGVTAGSSLSPASLIVHTANQVEFHAPILDNTAGGAVTFVKSGIGIVVLSHQGRTVSQGGIAAAPFTGPTWSSTNTGGWVINDGVINVHRGQYLGATPTTVTLNGGQLEINEPVSLANDATIIPGWGHHIVVNGNALIGDDDNGESADANTGDRSLVRLGSLTVNNGSLLGLAAFSDNDIAFTGGATFNGKAVLNIGAGGRSGVNNANIISGAVTGSGFDVVTLGGTAATLVLGGTQSDTVSSTYNGAVTLYAATVRLNKANGFTAITDGAASEDVIINGGNLFWGPGHHGDLATTNQVGTTTVGSPIAGTNNFGLFGIAPTSPAAIKNAGMNQVADTAVITLLSGSLGESDRITNEKWGTLIQKNGTVNVGLGVMEVDTAIISGGAMGYDRGGTFKAGTMSLLPGAYDLNVFTGRPTAGAFTTLEIGAGGISLTGQNITIGTAFSGNVAGAGGRLRLGGNVTVTGSDLVGGSYSRKGIYVQTGATFRELGASHVDLLGGTRDFNIESNVVFTVTPRVINGGISKSGGGALVLEPYEPSSFAGPVVVDDGIVQAKGNGAFGTSAGGVIINPGGTVKLDSGWTYGDDFTVAGPGSIIPGSGFVREAGALVAESSFNRLNGAVVLNGDATLAGNIFLDPSVVPGAGGLAWRIGTLFLAGAGGVTGNGMLNLSGHGDGIIANGVNTLSGGLAKDGAGRWTLAGAGSYFGATSVSAGTLRISNGAALGATGGATTVYGGATLELTGGISVAEPLNLFGDGIGVQSGAIVNLSGSNTLTGTITSNGTTLRSEAGNLTVIAAVNGGGNPLIVAGAGSGTLAGIVTAGPAAIGDAFVKNGTGTWTLSSANAILGSTAVNGGTLNLVGAGQKIDGGAAINMGGGNLNVTGAAQSAVGLNFLAGGGSVNGGAALNVGPITRSAGATANFTGAVSTTNTNTNGILGGYATVGSDWATVNGSSNIVALSGASYVDLATAGAAANASRPLFHLLTASTSVNSLKIAGGSGVDLGANNLSIGSGGLLYASAVAGGIGGTGLLAGASSADELIVHVTGAGVLDINAPLIGAGPGGLTKAGNGTLVLSGSSAFTGPININGGTLSIIGTGGTHPTALGASGNRDINLNGGTFQTVGGDYDPAASTMQFNIGPAGGTIRATLGAQISINDGTTTGLVPTQLRGSGDLTFSGGGRYVLSAGTPQFAGFTGNTTVDTGILTVGNSNTLGGRQSQLLTLKAGSVVINNTGFGLGQNGLPNNVIAEGGVEFFATGGSRAFAGDIQLSGTNTIGLFEHLSVGATATSTERQIFFNGRVSGTGITLNVFGSNNNTPFYLASGSNPITGTINLNANAVLEARGPGSVGVNTGDVTVNLNGANSRLLLRHFQNGDYRTNVVVNETAEINSDRLVNFGGGGLQILSINDLTFNGDNKILSIGGGNTYHTRVGGIATFNAPTNTILNVTASDLILENGLTFGTPGSTLDKRGGFSAILRNPTNHTGKLIVQGGLVHLQDNGSLSGTTSIELRGGELRVDNSAVVNTDRVNDAATITLGGGVLRITGSETIGVISAVTGTSQVVSNPSSETVPNPLTLTGFTRATGAVVQFQSPDVGATALAVGQTTIAQTRVGSRIFIPGQADTTQTIAGFLGNNNLDFVQYNGTTIDSGFALGVQDMRNPGNVNSPQNYTNDLAEGSWTDAIILRTSVATSTIGLTANRALDAWKIENTITTLNQGAFDLRIEGGGILAASANPVINGTTGRLYAGAAVVTAGTAELFIGAIIR